MSRYSFCVSWSYDANIAMSLIDISSNQPVAAFDEGPYSLTDEEGHIVAMPTDGDWLFGVQRDDSGYAAHFSGAIRRVSKIIIINYYYYYYYFTDLVKLFDWMH